MANVEKKMAKIKITQVKSRIGSTKRQKQDRKYEKTKTYT